MSCRFTPAEQTVLRIVQDNLPDSLTPYADMARQAGLTEAEVIDLLAGLKKSGAIRRFGASIKHQRTGWTHNAMVAWIVRPDQVEACGEKVAQHDHISHVYYRPSPAPDWPYELYTMIHGRSEAECRSVVDDILRDTPLREHAVLRSLKELKKISMTYFA
ncbi:MAG: Lrp/AsnC family transcriptional regulator [Desulfovibrio desulfuricans]|jgi:DNA-binding Lrp family transcriptional regulator|uniref:siroheme decarboxylase subunit beta n=1 Tax=uncultured Desulfovibrio sp. TaxID=167968 RepID=UPI001AFD48F1|nr:siroheme decarboxylase subunit beta [uncultured Desulfovibrio sp.]MBE6441815.1 Lrp/AsnC family transcriptional regulator [Desulfovibrio desulfuricans]MBO5490487.1 Lrp/AsnC family transcriptional regulator [Desulfovibrio sp.]